MGVSDKSDFSDNSEVHRYALKCGLMILEIQRGPETATVHYMKKQRNYEQYSMIPSALALDRHEKSYINH